MTGRGRGLRTQTAGSPAGLAQCPLVGAQDTTIGWRWAEPTWRFGSFAPGSTTRCSTLWGCR